MAIKKTPYSKAYKVVISVNALRNIDEITGFIAFINHQPLNAINVGDKIFDTIEKIERNPFAFSECEELLTVNHIYRKAVCFSWHIIYKIKAEQIIILGVIHSSQRPSKIKELRKVK